MSMRCLPAVLILLAWTVCIPRTATAGDLTFEKIQLTDRFHAEGAGIGDIDRDGHADAIYGPSWYAGPTFTEKHTIYPAEDFDPHKYSNNFITFVADVDRDGWLDVLANVWPGKEVAWFRNPGPDVKAASGWDRQIAFPVVDNESPTFADVTGDGRGEICFHTEGTLGFASPAENPADRWTFTRCSEPENWQRYTHGLGVGDVNGDGRADFLMASGWWEQPAERTGQLWKKHAFTFGPGGAQMHVADVDGDGDGDVITSLDAHGYGLAWFEQVPAAAEGDISFVKHLILPEVAEETLAGTQFSQPHAVAVADVNGDGQPDIITGKRYWAHGPKGDPDPQGTPVLYWFELRRDASKSGAEAVSFVPHRIDDASGVGCQFATGDLNGDGRLDLVIGNKRGGFVFRQRPAGG